MGAGGFDTSVGLVSSILPQRSSRVHAGSLCPAERSVTLDNVAFEQSRRQKDVSSAHADVLTLVCDNLCTAAFTVTV